MGRIHALLAVVLVLAGSSTGLGAVELASHRALYELRLDEVEKGSAIAEASGLLSVDWSRSCDGWTINQRLALVVKDSSGPSVSTEIVFSSFESFDGLTYSFTQKTTRDGRLIDEYRGQAGRDEVGGIAEARYTMPVGERRDLPAGTVFPMEHLRLLLDAAARGENRLFRMYFDGPRPAESPFDTNALILGGPREGAEGVGAGMGPLTEHQWWPVRIAFFPNASAEAVPDFELAANLQDNGVVRSYLFDYGEFRVAGDLTRVEESQSHDCG